MTALGQIPGRNESAVEEVINRAFTASIARPQPRIAIPQRGLHVQGKGFLLGVTPSRRLPGEELLTWGMWSDVLSSIHEYVEAYPGYDFAFEVWFVPPVGASSGYVIGGGLGITR